MPTLKTCMLPMINTCRRHWLGVVALVLLPACFGMIHEPSRHIYTLRVSSSHGSVLTTEIAGLLRVRDLDTASPFDRAQLVVRKTPFELSYLSRQIWAVRPGRMVSDLLAQALNDNHVFAATSRELGERRPDFVLSGEISALEIDNTDSNYTAHLALNLHITQADTGEILWNSQTDLRRAASKGNTAAAVATLSRLLDETIDTIVPELHKLQLQRVQPRLKGLQLVPGATQPPADEHW